MYEFDNCYYTDCVSAMKRIKSNSSSKPFDLCITDPPYGIDFTHSGSKTTKDFIKSKSTFDDHDIGTAWYTEAKRICNRIVFTPGITNVRRWMVFDDFDIVIWHNPTKQNESRAIKMTKYEPILCWNVRHPKKFKQGVITMPSENGFLRLTKGSFIAIHPCPKPIALYERIIDELRPYSVLDPFLGSGTTAESCISRGIPWTGYEIEKKYAVDIDKRIELGKEKLAARKARENNKIY